MSALAIKRDFSASTEPGESLEHDPAMRLSSRRAEIVRRYAGNLPDPKHQTERVDTRNLPEFNWLIAADTRVAPEQATLDFDLPEYKSVQPRSESFRALQEWEGSVLSIGGDVFEAELIDITAGETVPNERVELSVNDLQPEDISRLKEGAIFRWVIGYAFTPAGTKTRGSKMYFRRTAPRKTPPNDHDLDFGSATTNAPRAPS